MRSIFESTLCALLVICGAAIALADTATVRGTASWYGEAYRGRTMANGQPFDPDAITCAARDWPLRTVLRVRGVDSGALVIVIVTDVGPARRTGCVVDLSRAAFARIAPLERGRVAVEVTSLSAPRVLSTPKINAAPRSSIARGAVLSAETSPQNQTCRPVPLVAASSACVGVRSLRRARPTKALPPFSTFPALAAGLQQISPGRA